jgi:hypothetical protein
LSNHYIGQRPQEDRALNAGRDFLFGIHAPKGHLFCQTSIADNVRRKIALYMQGAIFYLVFTRQNGIFFVKPLLPSVLIGFKRPVRTLGFLCLF